jgi:iron complex outermembrane receptor protein
MWGIMRIFITQYFKIPYTGNFSYDIDNPRQVIEHHIAKVSAFKRFENIGKVSATYSYQYNHRQEYDIRRDLKDTPSLDLELMTHQFNLNDLLERGKFSWKQELMRVFRTIIRILQQKQDV